MGIAGAQGSVGGGVGSLIRTSSAERVPSNLPVATLDYDGGLSFASHIKPREQSVTRRASARGAAAALRSDCPIACSLDLIGDRWTLLIVRDLFMGKRRFSEFLESGE